MDPPPARCREALGRGKSEAAAVLPPKPCPSPNPCVCCSKKHYREGWDRDQLPDSQATLASLGFISGSRCGGVCPQAALPQHRSLHPQADEPLVGGRLFPADLHGRCRPAERFCHPEPRLGSPQRGFASPPPAPLVKKGLPFP